MPLKSAGPREEHKWIQDNGRQEGAGGGEIMIFCHSCPETH